MEKMLLDAKDIQKKVGVSRRNAYLFLNRADMPVVKIGERKYLHAALFEQWLAEQATGKKAEGET